jgi:hypothetical protein
MVTDEFRELNKETSKTLVSRESRHWSRESRERERKKKEKRSARKKRDRGPDRGRESERTEGHGYLRWRFGGGATTGFILRRAHLPPARPPPTYSDVRVLENYYINKYIHGGKFETSFKNIFFLN